MNCNHFWKCRIIAFLVYKVFLIMLTFGLSEPCWASGTEGEKDRYMDRNWKGFPCTPPSVIPPTSVVSPGCTFLFSHCPSSCLHWCLLSSYITNMEKLRSWVVLENCENLWNGSIILANSLSSIWPSWHSWLLEGFLRFCCHYGTFSWMFA